MTFYNKKRLKIPKM